MSRDQHLAPGRWKRLPHVLACAVLSAPLLSAADPAEVVNRASAALKADWAASSEYAWVERDEIQKNQQISSKTYQVVTFGGSDYYFPIAVNNEPLGRERDQAELEKFRNEYQRRMSETPAAREKRIESYRKQHEENDALIRELPEAFRFELQGEELKSGYTCYVLLASAKQRMGPLSRAAKVLSGMRGTVWVEKNDFHTVRADASVVAPVPIYGVLARVMPGTHVEFEMAPPDGSVWLITERSLTLKVTKFFFFSSTEVTRAIFSGYRPNGEVLEELLNRARGAASSLARVEPLR